MSRIGAPAPGSRTAGTDGGAAPANDGSIGYALAPVQSGMLFHALSEGVPGVDHEQVLVRFSTLDAPVDLERLVAAWRRVVARHDILRTAFDWLGRAEPRQVVCTDVQVRCDVVEVEDGGQDAHAAAAPPLEGSGSGISPNVVAPACPPWIGPYLDRDRRQPFALDRAPLMRWTLFTRGPREAILLWSFHHALLDGRSFPIVLGEVLALYDDPSGGDEALAAAPAPYREYIDWLGAIEPDGAAPAEEYFRRQLAGFREATPLPGGPARRSRTMEAEGDGAASVGVVRRSRTLDRERTAALRRFAEQHGGTVNTLLQGAWALLLCRASGERDVVFGATRACRRWDPAGGDRRVGLFINTLPLRAQPAPEMTVADFLGALRSQQLSLRPFEHTPLARVQKWSDIRRGQSLFDSLVVYDTADLDTRMQRLAGAPTDAERARRFAYLGQTNYALTLLGYDGDRLRIELELDPRRVAADEADSILDAVTALLEGLSADGQRPLRDVPSADPALRARLVASGQPRTHVPFQGSLHGRFAARAAEDGEAPALSCDGVRLSYRELDRCSTRLARELRRLGVGRNVLVGISAERSVELVIGILGILKAGGAYLPLDPHYPRDRLAFMIGDSGVTIVVADGDLGDLLRREGDAGGAAMRVDVGRFGPSAASASDDDRPLPDETGPDDLAYVIYTSGSTGKPKGAEINHGNVTRLFDATFAWFEYGPRDVWSMFHSCSFDFSVYELWGALLYGGKVVVVPWWVSRSPDAFYRLLVDEQVTMLCQTPSAFRQLTQAEAQLAPGAAGPLALRAIVFGGEALDMATLRPWVERHGADRPRLVNMYGITETTVHVTYRVITAEDVAGGAGSVIGEPIPDLGLLLVDGDGQPCPGCVPGELWVSGAGLSPGYRGRPQLTAERFVSRSFHGEPPTRYYRSGDLARRLPDGDIEYLGRIDLQVKIRGFRIELGEIESVLAEQPGVAAVVVDARPMGEDGGGERRLVAYVAAPASEPASLVAALRERLRARLPDHMVPSAIVVLPALPLNQNGKIDRKALPAPEPLRITSRAYEAPRSEAEVALCRIWSEVLGVAQVGVRDDFFELGGDSILCIQVVGRARAAGLALSPRDLFKRPTVAELATVAAPVAAAAAASTAKAAADDKLDGPLGLLPMQRWFSAQRLADPHHYNQSFLFEVSRDAEVPRLCRAIEVAAARHDAFRLRYRLAPDGTIAEQRYADVAPCAVEVRPLAPGQPAEVRAELERQAAAAQGSLELDRGPLLRAIVFQLGDGQAPRLLLVAHHLVVDGVSWRILVEDIDRAYEDPSGASLPARTSSLLRWSERLREHATSTQVAAERAFWEEAERGPAELPALPLVEGREAQDLEGAAETVRFSLTRDETEALLRRVPAAWRSRIQDALLAGLAAALAPAGQPVRVDVEGHGREDVFEGEGIDVSRTIGWFTSVYPVMLSTGAAEFSPSRAIKTVKEALRRVPRNGFGYPLLRQLPDGHGRTPLVGPPAAVLFNYLGQLDQVVRSSRLLRFAPEEPGPWHSPRGRRLYPLEVLAQVRDGAMEVALTFGPSRCERGAVEAAARRWHEAMGRILAEAERPEAGWLSPSDVPLSGLDQARIEALEAQAGGALEDIYPLTPMQALFFSMERAGSPVGLEQWRIQLDGPLDPAALASAWRSTVAHHPVLRTAFVGEGLREPLQVVHRHAEPRITLDDWRALDDGARAAGLLAAEAEERATAFDLARPPLTRLRLLRVAEERHLLLWTTHHLHIDGWSFPLVFRDLAAGYRTARGAGGAATASPTALFRDYVRHVRERARQADPYWSASLAGARPTPLELIAGAGRETQPAAGEVARSLSVAHTAQLAARARAGRTTISTLVQAAWACLLSHWSGLDDVIFGASFSGRPAEIAGIGDVVGPFVNNLPLRVPVRWGEPFGALLDALRELSGELAARQTDSLAAIQAASGLPARSRLFESLVVFQNYGGDEATSRLGDVRMTILAAPESTNYALTLAVTPGEALRLRLLWQRGRLDDQLGAAVLEQLEQLLVLLSGLAPDAALSSLLPAMERAWPAWPTWKERARSATRVARTPGSAAAPSSEMERIIEKLWRDLFGEEEIGLTDNFFDLGGHSLLLLEAHGRLREVLGRPDLPIVALLQYPTIQSLARHLAGDPGAASSVAGVVDRAQKQREAARAAARRQRRPPGT